MKPYFLLSKKKLLDQFSQLESRRFSVSYSVKTNPVVAHVLEQYTDCSFSIHTVHELKHIKDLSRVWFLGHALTEEILDELFKRHVSRFVIDNETDLDVLLKYIEKHEARISLLLRMKLKENTIFTGKYFVFGMDAAVTNRRAQELANHPLIDRLGIHFHRKTQNVGEWNLIQELDDSLDEKTLQSISLLNIGGGFPAKYKNISDNAISAVFERVCQVQSWAAAHDITLMVEPGRYLAAPCIELHTHVQSVLDRDIVINASVYNCAMDTIIVPIKLLVKGEKDGGKQFTIKGCTPCSLDIFRYDVRIERPRVGDEIVLLNAGAYTYSTTFCDLEPVETKITD
ncbi:decarboxylase [Candidatus Woesearchaeota archaeon]|nr:decarboxylase [Candidatus Woesearchaeota archaeon]